MLTITITTIGRPRQRWISDGVEHYRKLLSKYAQVSLQHLKETSTAAPSDAEIRRRESDLLIEAINSKAVSVLLDVAGKSHSSESFATWLEKSKQSTSHIQFLIGGAHGVTDKLRDRVEARLSLSSLTLPHELALIVLLEQLYRASSILSGSKYHK